MIFRFLAAALASVALLVAVPSPAQAATTGIKCDRYLNTAYGPVGQCTQDTGAWGRVGMYSPLTNSFSPTSDFLRFTLPNGRNYFGNGFVRATDGVVGQVNGYGQFETAFGPGVYATQVRPDGMGRWGVWSHVTGLFYPSSGWMSFCCMAR